MNNNPENIEENKQDDGPEPNENDGIIFSSSIKITDPNPQEFILHVRGAT